MKKSDRLPKSAMALYVKLYCKKNERIKNRKLNLMDASKSWVSLSKTEKQYFLNVFKNYEAKVKRYFASNLQRAQLYMKKKHGNPKKPCTKVPKQATIDYNNFDEGQGIHKINNLLKDANNELEVMDVQKLNDCNTTTIAVENVTADVGSNENWVEPDMVRSISEPAPPVRTSMELHEIIKRNGEIAQNVNWADLSKLQKQRYQRAVLNIKNNYLKQYTAYLQQLPLEKLYQYYKSKF